MDNLHFLHCALWWTACIFLQLKDSNYTDTDMLIWAGIMQSVTSRSREFPFPGICLFFWWYRNRYRKNLVPKKVPEPVSDFFGTEKSLGTGLGKFWYRKKVSESVSFRFWVSSHTDRDHMEVSHLRGISIPWRYCGKAFSSRAALRRLRSKYHDK